MATYAAMNERVDSRTKTAAEAATAAKEPGAVAGWARALRAMPAAMAILAALGMIGGVSCGGSFYPQVTGSPTASTTTTISPTAGNFLFSSNNGDGKVAEFKRNKTTGVIALTGSVAAGSSGGPIGIANGPGSKYVYVANSVDGKVQQYKVTPSTGVLTSIGTIATGSQPQWIAVNPAGTYAFVTNQGAGGAAGTISQYAVSASAGTLTSNGGAFSSSLLTSPQGAVATSAYLLVADRAQGSVASFPISSTGTLSAGTSAAIGNGAGFSFPVNLVLDPANYTSLGVGYLYAADATTGFVYAVSYSLTNGQPAYLNSFPSSTAGLGGMAIAQLSGGEFLYVANQKISPPSITSFIVTPGTLTFAALYTDPSLNLPTGLAIGPNQTNLYVANQGNGTISQFAISSTGALTFVKVVNTESPTSAPLYLTLTD